MSIHLQPLVTLVKTEPPTVIKKEPLEEDLEDINTDIKDIDIVYHSLSEDVIKSETRDNCETVLEDIFENKHLESVQTKALVVKAENSPFTKTENITQRIKSEDSSDGNVSRGTGQGIVVVQASNKQSNALSNLETDEQSVLNVSKNLTGISVRSRKSKSPKKIDFAEYYKTYDTTVWKKEKEKIKIIKAPVIPVEVHEYTSLAKDKHVCNHCQNAFKSDGNLKRHIKHKHRKLTTIYQCPYCSHKSKWSECVKQHIILKHKDAKNIQWFQCNLCDNKFKLRKFLTVHMKIHLKHKQMQNELNLREKRLHVYRYHCDECDYKTYKSTKLKNHKLSHLKLEEIQHFYCYYCSYKAKRKGNLKEHIFGRHFKNVKRAKRYGCNKCNYKTYKSTNFNNHKLTHLKPEEIQYFYCYHCSYKAKRKGNLKEHIFRRHFKNVKQAKRYGWNKCNYETYKSTNFNNHKLSHIKVEEIQHFYCYHCSFKAKRKGNLKEHIFMRHFKNVKQAKRYGCNKCNYETYKSSNFNNHKLTHLKPEEIQYFYCYHCSYKSNRKGNLKEHIFRHFKKGQVKFDCYICNFMTMKRESIIQHIKKHSKVQN